MLIIISVYIIFWLLLKRAGRLWAVNAAFCTNVEGSYSVFVSRVVGPEKGHKRIRVDQGQHAGLRQIGEADLPVPYLQIVAAFVGVCRYFISESLRWLVDTVYVFFLADVGPAMLESEERAVGVGAHVDLEHAEGPVVGSFWGRL